MLIPFCKLLIVAFIVGTPLATQAVTVNFGDSFPFGEVNITSTSSGGINNTTTATAGGGNSSVKVFSRNIIDSKEQVIEKSVTTEVTHTTPKEEEVVVTQEATTTKEAPKVSSFQNWFTKLIETHFNVFSFFRRN